MILAVLQDVQTAPAQDFPQRTVKFIVPLGAGSGTDIAARLVADRLSVRWGKPVVIENRPGGDGLVSINAFLAAKDDHTLLWAPVSTFAVHPYQYDKLSYDAERDLLPIVNVSSTYLAFAAPASMNIGSFREFFELVRVNPGKYNFAASSGNGDFLITGFLKSGDLHMAKVPYRDITRAPTDLGENRIQLLSVSLAVVTPLMHAGKIKVLAVTGRKRATSAPDVPTVRELGYPALEMESMVGLFGSASMPLTTREKIAEDVRVEVEGNVDIATKLDSTGQIVDLRRPKEFADAIKETRNKLAEIAKLLDMKIAQ